jgi:hypothetical protein
MLSENGSLLKKAASAEMIVDWTRSGPKAVAPLMATSTG